MTTSGDKEEFESEIWAVGNGLFRQFMDVSDYLWKSPNFLKDQLNIEKKS